MEYTIALVIGIFSSLIATVGLVGLSELFRRVLLPLYSDAVYKGVRIDGKWVCCLLGKTPPPSEITNEMILNQKADQVFGLSILNKPGEAPPNIYVIRGQIRDGYFSATMVPKESDKIDAATCLLRVYSADGKLRLKGRNAYINSVTAEVEAGEVNIEYCRETR